eukprot:Gb_14712 [translate_table: standard]
MPPTITKRSLTFIRRPHVREHGIETEETLNEALERS